MDTKSWAQKAVEEYVPAIIADGESFFLFNQTDYNVAELSVEIIRFAAEVGFPVDLDDIHRLVEQEEYVSLDDFQWDAIEYLNDVHCPKGGWWGHDGLIGAFGCWVDDHGDAA